MDPTVLQTSLTRWLETFSSSPPLNIHVASSPHTSSHFIFTTRDYLNGPIKWTVERSLGDYALLRSELLKRFPGLVMSGMPETHPSDVLTSKRSHVVGKQIDALFRMVTWISRHPFLSQDVLFLTFLSSVGTSFRDAIGKLEAQGSIVLSSSSSGGISSLLGGMKVSRFLPLAAAVGGIRRRSTPTNLMLGPVNQEPKSPQDYWRVACELALDPLDPLKLARDVHVELDLVEHALQSLKDNLRVLLERNQGMRDAHSEVAKALSGWIAAEFAPNQHVVRVTSSQSSSSVPLASIADSNDPAVSLTMVRVASRALKAHEQAADLHGRVVGNVSSLMGAIRFEMLLLKSLNKAWTIAKDKYTKFKTAEKDLETKQGELAAAEEAVKKESPPNQFAYNDSADMFEKRTRAVRKARDDAVEVRDTALAEATLLLRSTMNVDYQLFRNERILRADMFFREFAEIQSRVCKNAQEIWGSAAALEHAETELLGSDLALMDQSVASASDDLHNKPSSFLRLDRLQSATSALSKSGSLHPVALPPPPLAQQQATVHDDEAHQKEEEEEEEEEDDDDEQSQDEKEEEDSFTRQSSSNKEQRRGSVESNASMGQRDQWEPWPKEALNEEDVRDIVVAFDFEAMHEDELTVHVGDVGTAHPFGKEGEWLMVKTETGEGIVPTDFVRCQKKPSSSRRGSVVSSLEEHHQPNDAAHSTAALESLSVELANVNREADSLREQVATSQTECHVLRQHVEERDAEIERLKKDAEAREAELASLRSQLLEKSSVSSMIPQAKTESTTTTNEDQGKLVKSRRASKSNKTIDDEPLPEGWVRGWNEKHQRAYYHNSVLKKSQWVRPTKEDDMNKTTSLTGKRKQNESQRRETESGDDPPSRTTRRSPLIDDDVIPTQQQ